jgi:transposase
VTYLFEVGGRQWLSVASLDAAYRLRVNALLRLIDAIDFEITAVAGPLRVALADHAGFRAVQKVPGVGPALAAIFVADIGDVTRFASPRI